MEIKINDYGKEILLKIEDDLDLYDLMDEIRGLLAMLGFAFESIDGYFDESEMRKQGWIFQYEKRLKKGEITPEEIGKLSNILYDQIN